jgi:hypothetical protein
MTRFRLAALVVVAGSGLLSGCCNIGQGQLMDRLFHRHCDCECGRTGCGPVNGTLTGGSVYGDGPILEEPGVYPSSPPGVMQGEPPVFNPTPVPGSTTPVPGSATPVPAGPSPNGVTRARTK